jgi:hypothetical protein
MNENEITKFLRENLTVEFNEAWGWGGRLERKLTFKTKEEVITECYLPTIPNHD